MYRACAGRLEVLLAHPGGPFWTKRDDGAWSIPKGEVSSGEDALSTAKREFEEETGIAPPGELVPLGVIKQKGGKTVEAWAFEGNCDPTAIKSNTFVLEWPPRSGKAREFPEIDRAGFFDIEEAKQRINAAQAAFLSKLVHALADRSQANRVLAVVTAVGAKSVQDALPFFSPRLPVPRLNSFPTIFFRR